MTTRPVLKSTTGEWKFADDLKQTTPGALNGTLKLQSVNYSRKRKKLPYKIEKGINTLTFWTLLQSPDC